MKTTVIYHKADYDGIFCREIARKFLPDAELIGWDFGDTPVTFPEKGIVYVMDLPLDCLCGDNGIIIPFALMPGVFWKRIVWIDHHKSAIEKFAGVAVNGIPGYRIDGVAACRLAWVYFRAQKVGHPLNELHSKQDFLDRKVSEPLAVRLAGEYDIWDHRGDGDLEFQFGLDAMPLTPAGWNTLLQVNDTVSAHFTRSIVQNGAIAMNCYAKRDADIIRERSFLVDFEGYKFLALNTARCNSNTFAALDVPSTGHDALMGFYFNGEVLTVSLYHANHRKDLDLSLIAVKYGGGGSQRRSRIQNLQTPVLTPLRPTSQDDD